MNIFKLAEDLVGIVNPKAFISEGNLQRLNKLSSAKKRDLYDEVNGNEKLGEINFYKAAFLHGRDRFKKEAENLMIWKGIQEHKKLVKEGTVKEIAKKVGKKALQYGVPAAAGAAGGYGAVRAGQSLVKKKYERENRELEARLRGLKSGHLATLRKFSSIKRKALAAGVGAVGGAALAGTGTKGGKKRVSGIDREVLKNKALKLQDEIISARLGVRSRGENRLLNELRGAQKKYYLSQMKASR